MWKRSQLFLDRGVKTTATQHERLHVNLAIATAKGPAHALSKNAPSTYFQVRISSVKVKLFVDCLIKEFNKTETITEMSKMKCFTFTHLVHFLSYDKKLHPQGELKYIV